MATKSFTREIRITEPSAVKKIQKAMNTTDSKNTFKTSIVDITERQAKSRKNLASYITKKY